MTDDKPRSHLVVLAGLILAAIASLAVVSFAPTKAKAQTPLQVYAGVHGGYSMMSTEVSSPLAPGFSIDGLGSKGLVGGLHAGVDTGFPGSIWFAGIFGDYTWQKVDFSINPLATARLGDSWTVGGRAGITSGKSKYYGLVGYTQAESSITGGMAMPVFKGVTYGVGTSYNLANNLVASLEARMTHFQSATVVGTPIDLQPDQLSVRFGLSLQLGNMPSPVATPPLK